MFCNNDCCNSWSTITVICVSTFQRRIFLLSVNVFTWRPRIFRSTCTLTFDTSRPPLSSSSSLSSSIFSWNARFPHVFFAMLYSCKISPPSKSRQPFTDVQLQMKNQNVFSHAPFRALVFGNQIILCSSKFDRDCAMVIKYRASFAINSVNFLERHANSVIFSRRHLKSVQNYVRNWVLITFKKKNMEAEIFFYFIDFRYERLQIYQINYSSVKPEMNSWRTILALFFRQCYDLFSKA